MDFNPTTTDHPFENYLSQYQQQQHLIRSGYRSSSTLPNTIQNHHQHSLYQPSSQPSNHHQRSSMAANAENTAMSRQASMAAQYELVKKILEKKKIEEQQLIQEQQYQNQLNIKRHQMLQLQLQQIQQQQQQQLLISNQREEVIGSSASSTSSTSSSSSSSSAAGSSSSIAASKEYILAKLKAQREAQSLNRQMTTTMLQGRQSDMKSPPPTTLPSQDEIISQQAAVMQQVQPQSQLPPAKLDPIEKLKMLLIKNNQLNQKMNQKQPSTEPPATTSIKPSIIDPPPVDTPCKPVEMSSEGVIKNIPPTMMVDQYGMLGLAMMFGETESSSSNSSLPTETDQSVTFTAVNQNTTSLDTNVSIIIGRGNAAKTVLKRCNESVYGSDQLAPHLRPNGYGLFSTSEYNCRGVRERLGDMDSLMRNSRDDLLFYLFYMCCRDELQDRAYQLLVERDWVFNKEAKIWIKVGGSELQPLYYVFDVESWQIKKILA